MRGGAEVTPGSSSARGSGGTRTTRSARSSRRVGIFVGWIDVVWAGPCVLRAAAARRRPRAPGEHRDRSGAGARPGRGTVRGGAPYVPLLRPSPRARLHAFAGRLPGLRARRRLLSALAAVCALALARDGRRRAGAGARLQPRPRRAGRPVSLRAAADPPLGCARSADRPGAASARGGRPRPPWHQLPERRGGQRDLALLPPRAAQRPRPAARRRCARAARHRRDRAGPERRLHGRLGRAQRSPALAAHRQPHARRGRARGGRRDAALPDLARRVASTSRGSASWATR